MMGLNPEEQVVELRSLVQGTRRLVEGSRSSPEAAAMAVMLSATIIAAKSQGMTREQYVEALGHVWDCAT